MALYVRQSEDRSKLQERVAAELQEKAKARAEQSDRPDGVSDSNYLKDTKPTTSLAWIWALIVLVVLGAMIYFALVTAQ